MILAEMSPLWEQVAAAGLPATLMAAAVWWLQGSNKALVSEIREQWNARLNDLATQNRLCEEDRKRLNNIIIGHAGRLDELEHPAHSHHAQ